MPSYSEIYQTRNAMLEGLEQNTSLYVETNFIERMKATFPPVADQDIWALERQQKMFAFAEDGYSEVHLRSDRAILIVRKILQALEKGVTKEPTKSWLAA